MFKVYISCHFNTVLEVCDTVILELTIYIYIHIYFGRRIRIGQ